MKVSGNPGVSSASNISSVAQSSAKATNSINYFDSHNPLASLAYMHARNSSFPSDKIGNTLDIIS